MNNHLTLLLCYTSISKSRHVDPMRWLVTLFGLSDPAEQSSNITKGSPCEMDCCHMVLLGIIAERKHTPVRCTKHVQYSVFYAGLAKTTSRPSRRSGFCLFDQKPLVFGVFAVVFAQHGESASSDSSTTGTTVPHQKTVETIQQIVSKLVKSLVLNASNANEEV